MFLMKSSVFSTSKLLTWVIFYKLGITKSLYKIMAMLMLRFKVQIARDLWDFVILPFARILLPIWCLYINFTRWATGEITDLSLIIFARLIKTILLSSFLEKFMGKTCWNIFLTTSSKQCSSTDEITSILESNTSQLFLMSELDILD